MHPKAKTDIPIEKVAKCFNLPIHLAAEKLHVGETWLKQKCREHNIKRWPYRKVSHTQPKKKCWKFLCFWLSNGLMLFLCLQCLLTDVLM